MTVEHRSRDIIYTLGSANEHDDASVEKII